MVAVGRLGHGGVEAVVAGAGVVVAAGMLAVAGMLAAVVGGRVAGTLGVVAHRRLVAPCSSDASGQTHNTHTYTVTHTHVPHSSNAGAADATSTLDTSCSNAHGDGCRLICTMLRGRLPVSCLRCVPVLHGCCVLPVVGLSGLMPVLVLRWLLLLLLLVRMRYWCGHVAPCPGTLGVPTRWSVGHG